MTDGNFPQHHFSSQKKVQFYLQYNTVTICALVTNYDDVKTSSDIYSLKPCPAAKLLGKWTAECRQLVVIPYCIYGSIFHRAEPGRVAAWTEISKYEWQDWMEQDFGITKEEYGIDRGLRKLYRSFGWNTDAWDRSTLLERKMRWDAYVYQRAEKRMLDKYKNINNLY